MAMASDTTKAESLRFLKPHQAIEVRDKFGTPCFVYDQRLLKQAASEVLAFPNAFGLTGIFYSPFISLQIYLYILCILPHIFTLNSYYLSRIQFVSR